MSLKFLLLPLLLASFFCTNVSAQITFAGEESNDLLTMIAPNVTDIDGVFFMDPESKVCFIDFAMLDGYAKHLVVRNGDEIIVDERVWELPTNTIYELDYANYSQGNYLVELHTYSKVVQKRISVN